MKKTITILTISTFLFLSCGKEKKETATNNEPAIAVKVNGISADTNGEFVTASGKIEAENSANVSTRMMGYVTKVNVKVGQKVNVNLQGTTTLLTKGTVTYCAPYLSKKSIFSDRADNLEDRRVREVHVRVDNPEAVLIGSRVECIILL